MADITNRIYGNELLNLMGMSPLGSVPLLSLAAGTSVYKTIDKESRKKIRLMKGNSIDYIIDNLQKIDNLASNKLVMGLFEGIFNNWSTSYKKIEFGGIAFEKYTPGLAKIKSDYDATGITDDDKTKIADAALDYLQYAVEVAAGIAALSGENLEEILELPQGSLSRRRT